MNSTDVGHSHGLPRQLASSRLLITYRFSHVVLHIVSHLSFPEVDCLCCPCALLFYPCLYLQNHPTRKAIFDFMFVQLRHVQSNSFYLP